MVEQDKVNSVPQKIKRFNWGAFFLTDSWSARHGLCIWNIIIFLILVILNFVILDIICGGEVSLPVSILLSSYFLRGIIFGFMGNEWAWPKNKYHSADDFLKTQRNWAISGAVVISLIIAVFSYCFIYVSNKVLEIVNNNDRAVEYFGSPITKDGFWSDFHYSSNLNGEYLSDNFQAKGSKRSGRIEIEWGKKKNFSFTQKLVITTESGESLTIINPRIDGSFVSDGEQFYIEDLEKTLDRAEHDLGFLIFKRSDDLNDYMQIAVDDDGKNGFLYTVEYSHGYTLENLNLFSLQSDARISRNEVLTLLYMYLGGTDDFKTLRSWKKLTPEDMYINSDTGLFRRIDNV